MSQYHLPIETQFHQARTEALDVLTEQYQYLCKSLEKKAKELAQTSEPPNWVGEWQQFRTNPDPEVDIADIITKLPKWAQIQFSQISTLGIFVSNNNDYIQHLQEEIQYSFQRGLQRGKTLVETDDLDQIANNRNYPTYLRNYARTISRW